MYIELCPFCNRNTPETTDHVQTLILGSIKMNINFLEPKPGGRMSFSEIDEFEFEYFDNEEIDFTSTVDQFTLDSPSKKKYKSSCYDYSTLEYYIYSFDEAKKNMEKIIQETAILLGIKDSVSQQLLQKFKWNQETLIEQFLEDPEQISRSLGILLSPQKTTITIEKDFFCTCLCEEGDLETFSLSCEHKFCKDCYAKFVETCIYQGKIQLKCMSFDCNLMINPDYVRLLSSEKTFFLYEKKLFEDYVRSKKKLAWCPASNCENLIECTLLPSPLDSTTTVVCSCGFCFCICCGCSDHRPLLCKYKLLWDQKCDEESKNRSWLLSHTKLCPKCSSSIEKHGGCNHMTCTHCSYEFCWLCLLDWKTHSYDRCNTFTEDTKILALVKKDTKSTKPISTSRFSFYHLRFLNHVQSISIEKGLVRTSQLPNESSSSYLNYVNFIKQALDSLVEARTHLQWAYAFAYFLKKTNFSIIFDENLNYLEDAVEDLGAAVLRSQKNNQTRSHLESKILRLTEYVKSRQKSLIQEVYSGYAENKWSLSNRVNDEIDDEVDNEANI
ncbi:hypothetical protein BB560_003583 [Smittium megazygosporum]|uniref:RBR-type E3 ubiquitin transferase n=1 Tax=Smittium megazygosporum TaxID=133381 RepID=A0A2T9ZBR1_9FUNG|nr:hypothetical protein BB560_003583 [Smittium megazygosporum]